MNKFLKIFLLVAAIVVLFFGLIISFGFRILHDLGAHYEIENTKVYWVHALNHDLKQARVEIEDADPETFQAFSFGKSHWASDKGHVYFEGRLLRDADPNDFEITDLENHLSRSGENEYKGSRKTRNDAEQFVSYGMYSKDVHGAYWFDKKIPGADPKTFELLEKPETEYKNDSAWAADANSLYCDGRVLKDSDPATFRLLGHDYGVDKHRVYFESVALSDANPQSFTVTYHDTKYVVGYDGNYIWQFGKRTDATEEQKALVRVEQK